MIPTQAQWSYIREAVSSADSSGLLTTTNSNWDAKSTTRGMPIPAGAQALQLVFIGDHASDPEDKTATVKVTVYDPDGPAMVVQAFDLTVGGQKVLRKPRRSVANATAKWVETIVPSAADPAHYWFTEPTILGVKTDNVASIAFKTYGAAYMTVEITALAAGLILDVLSRPIDRLP